MRRTAFLSGHRAITKCQLVQSIAVIKALILAPHCPGGSALIKKNDEMEGARNYSNKHHHRAINFSPFFLSLSFWEDLSLVQIKLYREGVQNPP